MKDYRFYLEYPNKKEKNKATRKNLGDHSGTCLAVFGDPFSKDDNIFYECVAALFDKHDSEVTTTSCSWGYLRHSCKRVSADTARQIHPKLFKYLEQ
ncbi:MAG TPA: hypothetical protein VE868_05305 [Balneolaceae bacterium]|nr:hypothetical protein [Balneolaceae bacterium]